MAIKISVVGHTNSGKTTLIRTLLRKPIGEVDDRANVTQLSKPEEFEDFYATLVDTPGFQNAAGYLAFMKARKKHGDEAAQTIKETISLDYEVVVVEAIQKCDACIYVASLETVPDEAMLSEVKLVSSLCESLIVVLNKNREFAQKESKEEAKHRKRLWTKGCGRFEVTNIVDYDAHWASPSMTYKFLEEVEKILPTEKRQRFQQGITAFKFRQENARGRVIEYALECIIKCRKIDLSAEIRKKPNEDNEQYKARIDNRLPEMCRDELSEFMSKAMDLYELSAKLPTLRIDNWEEFTPKLAKMGSAQASAALATFTAAIFGIGGILVGSILGIPVAGAASVSGIVGSGLGAFVGFADASSEQDRLQAVQAGYVAVICLGILWILSCYGWGKGTKVPEYIVKAIDERTKEIIPGIDSINWHSASSDEMKSWIIRFLERVAD